ncbi:MAG: efflux RND transporter periplasmic adaptor subunit [Verrucomicrobiae bacterium]
MLRKIKIFLPLLALAVLFEGCKKPAPPGARPPRPVIAAIAESADVPLYIDQIGRCVAFERVMIRPQVSGPVTAIHFADGADIKIGDLLFTIDPRPFQASCDAALATLTQVQAKAEFDISQLKRSQKLSDNRVVSPQDLDSARSAEQSSQAGLNAARAGAETAKINLAYSSISSPVNGRTGKHLVDIGNIVKANETDMLEIQRQQPIYIEFIIPENALPRVRSYLAKGTLAVEAALPDDPSSARTGKLDFLDSGVNPDSGTVLLRGVFENEDRFFWPGQFVRVRILLDTLRSTVLIPAEAVQTGADNLFVFVISPDNKAVVRAVKTGQLQGHNIVISEGVQAGEKVVVTGQLGLSNGAAVRPQSP